MCLYWINPNCENCDSVFRYDQTITFGTQTDLCKMSDIINEM